MGRKNKLFLGHPRDCYDGTMGFLPPVRLSLITGPNDSDPNQDKLRLEPEVQKGLDSYHGSFSKGKPFPTVILALLTAWFEGGRGRKVRFEIGPPLTGVGEVKRIEAANEEELNALIGDGKTLSTFLPTFASVEPVLAQ
jgi:hypothetical protein